MMPRYAILYHQMPADGPRPSHWDLLLQSGDTLHTWALAEQPATGVPIAAERLADHRIEYLDYEGPVSQNRGNVARWDSGTFQWLRNTRSAVAVDLRGERLIGQVTITRWDEPGGRWEFLHNPSAAAGRCSDNA